MKKYKYKVTFITIKGNKFTRICTRTFISVISFAFRTAYRYKAMFYIKK